MLKALTMEGNPVSLNISANMYQKSAYFSSSLDWIIDAEYNLQM